MPKITHNKSLQLSIISPKNSAELSESSRYAPSFEQGPHSTDLGSLLQVYD